MLATELALYTRLNPDVLFPDPNVIVMVKFIWIRITLINRSVLSAGGCRAYSHGRPLTPRTVPAAEARTEKRTGDSEIICSGLVTTNWRCFFTWTGSCSTVIPPRHSVYLFVSTVFLLSLLQSPGGAAAEDLNTLTVSTRAQPNKNESSSSHGKSRSSSLVKILQW